MRLFLIYCCAFLVSCGDTSPIKIGAIGGLSGRYSELGVAGRNGVDLAIIQANRDGGIQGRKLLMVPADDQNSHEECKKVLTSLIDSDVQFFIGPYTSNMAAATLSSITNNKSFVISPTISTDEVTNIDDNFFRVMTTNQDKAFRSAQYINESGHTNIAVSYDVKNAAFAQTLCNQFQAEFKKINPRATIHVIPVDTTKEPFSSIAQKIISSKATALFNITAGIDGAALCQQLAKKKSKILILGAVWMRTNDLIEHGGRTVEGVRFVGKYDTKEKTPAYNDFVEQYKKQFGITPSFSAFYSFEATNILINAMKSIKQITPEAVKNEILRTKVYQGLQEPISFNQYGDVQRKATVTKVQNGEFVIDE